MELESFQARLEKAESDLCYVANVLEKEFNQQYDNKPHLNPVRLIARLRMVQERLPALQSQCESLTQSKEATIEACKRGLLSQRQRLRELQREAGMRVVSDNEDGVYQDFKEMSALWAEQNLVSSQPHH
ncbi:hypothetical protein QOT17_013198 [Balamuthia mandrillaris]